jgi:hypothetical protein
MNQSFIDISMRLIKRSALSTEITTKTENKETVKRGSILMCILTVLSGPPKSYVSTKQMQPWSVRKNDLVSLSVPFNISGIPHHSLVTIPIVSRTSFPYPLKNLVMYPDLREDADRWDSLEHHKMVVLSKSSSIYLSSLQIPII